MFTKIYCLLNEETSNSTNPTTGVTAQDIAQEVKRLLEQDDSILYNINQNVISIKSVDLVNIDKKITNFSVL